MTSCLDVLENVFLLSSICLYNIVGVDKVSVVITCFMITVFVAKYVCRLLFSINFCLAPRFGGEESRRTTTRSMRAANADEFWICRRCEHREDK
jgi:hypothetical protein